MQPLGELDAIKQLPGFQRAAANTLAKAWSAGLSLGEESGAATDVGTKVRLASLALLERDVLAHLQRNQLRPRDLVDAASKRVAHARTIFGRIEIHGSTEMSPVWRPLLSMLAKQTEVVWIAEARHVPEWLSTAGIVVERSPTAKPLISTISCAARVMKYWRRCAGHVGILPEGASPQEIAMLLRRLMIGTITFWRWLNRESSFSFRSRASRAFNT